MIFPLIVEFSFLSIILALSFSSFRSLFALLLSFLFGCLLERLSFLIDKCAKASTMSATVQSFIFGVSRREYTLTFFHDNTYCYEPI